MMRWLAERGLLVRFVAYAVALVAVTAVAWFGTRRELDPPPVEDFAPLAALLGKHLCAARGDAVHLADETRRVRANFHVPVAIDAADGTELVPARGLSREFVHGARLEPLSQKEVDLLARQPDHQLDEQTFVSACIVEGKVELYVLIGRPPVARYVSTFSPPLMALVLVLAFIPLARSIVRPVERITAAARAFGAGQLRARVGMKRRDELGTLANVFDDMAARLERLIRSERELLANVSHELRTPLSRIRVLLELASDVEAHDVRRYLAEVATDLAELERLVDDVLTSARLNADTAGAGGPPLRWARIAPAAIVDDIAARFAERHPTRELHVKRDGLPEELELDAMMVRRAIENVLDNAVTHSRADRAVVLRVAPANGGFEVAVEDSGVGMTDSELSQLFTPFYRADSSRTRSSGGVGLGLALARSIARAHGGDARVESAAGVGTVVSLTFFGRDGIPDCRA